MPPQKSNAGRPAAAVGLGQRGWKGEVVIAPWWASQRAISPPLGYRTTIDGDQAYRRPGVSHAFRLGFWGRPSGQSLPRGDCRLAPMAPPARHRGAAAGPDAGAGQSTHRCPRPSVGRRPSWDNPPPLPAQPAAACPHARNATWPQPENRNPGMAPLPPLCINARPDTNLKIFVYTVFVSRGDPGWKHPPAFFPPKNFQTKNPAWVAGGVGLGPWRRRGGWGWFRRTPGRVARLPMPFPLGAPFRGRGGAVSGPQSRRFIFPGGGLGAHFRVPVLPAGEVGQEKGDGTML